MSKLLEDEDVYSSLPEISHLSISDDILRNEPIVHFTIGDESQTSSASCISSPALENANIPDKNGINISSNPTNSDFFLDSQSSIRSINELEALFKAEKGILPTMSDRELVLLIDNGLLKQHDLENLLNDENRAVVVRRLWLSKKANSHLQALPHQPYDYSLVTGACCENVLGYIPIPVGYAGPLNVNGRRVFVPLATTEGCLVAGVNRGCRVIAVRVEYGTIDDENLATATTITTATATTNQQLVNSNNNSNCTNCKPLLEDAGGVSATVYNDGMTRAPVVQFESARESLELKEWLEISSNYLLVKQTFDSTSRTNVDQLVYLAQSKLLVGSAMAAGVGGFNAQAANIVAAVFLATGQDIGQVVTSSMCLTLLEKTDGGDLYTSCTMPCLEVGTRGGGTILPAQRTCLEMLGCAGGHPTFPGKNAQILAEILCSTVLAGELSLLAAQCTGDLVRSHMKFNRSQLDLSVPDAKNAHPAGKLGVPVVGTRARRHPATVIGKLATPGCSNVL